MLGRKEKPIVAERGLSRPSRGVCSVDKPRAENKPTLCYQSVVANDEKTALERLTNSSLTYSENSHTEISGYIARFLIPNEEEPTVIQG